jgi:tetratricopeptide (TPR) repeat protein
VQLFVERVQLVQPGFVLDDSVSSAVTSVVSELDGIPLAIELAAAAAGQLSIDELVAGLDDRFNVLTNGRRTAPARQQTLYAVVDWSFGLLAPPEQQLLRRLAVFSGTFSAEAVDAVASPARGSLDRLVSASLVVPESSLDAAAPVRYRLLETVRAFAQSQLDEAGEADAVRTAHLDWALQLATDAHAEVRGPEAPRVLQAVERDHDNLRAALAWGIAGGRPASSVALSAKLVAFWDARGHRIEGVRWLQDSLAAAGDDLDPTVKIDALIELAGISMTNDLEQSLAAFHDAVAQADAAGDDHRGAIARMGLGMLLGNHGDYDEAIPLLDASLTAFRDIGDLHNTALALERLSDLVRDEGDEVRFRELIDEAVELQRASGDRRELFWSVASLSQKAVMSGDRERAVVGLIEARALTDELEYLDGDAWISCCEGMFQLADGNVEAATERFDHALEVVRATQELVIIEWAAAGVSWCASYAGDLPKARSVLVEQNEVGVMGDVPRTKFYRALHAAIAAASGGEWDLAARLWCGAQAVCPVLIPVAAGQDVVDMKWLDEVLPKQLGEPELKAMRDEAQRSCESGTNPVDEAFELFDDWSPGQTENVTGPPLWLPW